jgi:radical SAM protein with 4Fe4S-binding SPASM domain
MVRKKAEVFQMDLSAFPLWKKRHPCRRIIDFDLELTARCNHRCRHCYIHLPAEDPRALGQELSLHEIKEIVSEATRLGALWCLLTGGEPLLRKDFPDIYLFCKERGLLVSVFTNATLISPEIVQLFQKYPPRDIEVTVYGVTERTYEKVTGQKGSFSAFQRGLNLLRQAGIRVRLKAMALRSNFQEMGEIARFCQERTKDFFRFDPFLRRRYDGDPNRNQEILAERLHPEEIVALERSDAVRFQILKRCFHPPSSPFQPSRMGRDLFRCGAGIQSFTVSYEGHFKLCSALVHPDCIYDLRRGNLFEAWNQFVPQVLGKQSDRIRYLQYCESCPLTDLCFWCPAHSYLENGRLDDPVDYFCQVAKARAQMLDWEEGIQIWEQRSRRNPISARRAAVPW